MDALAVSEIRIPEEVKESFTVANGLRDGFVEENKFSKAIASWRGMGPQLSLR
jgi:hypothetical protein